MSTIQHEESEIEARYGVTDYRTIRPWVFAARVLLRPKRRARMSIGTLHVNVVEARGLMARDGMLRRSDPYVNLDLSGRYLSNGQEWSEQFRIKEQTRVIKYSLNPVWNESFSLPVRRAGAFLRVELWDWDRGSSDDPLGSFEVKVGEELLSQKAMDIWFVLETPRDLKKSSSPSSSGLRMSREMEKEQPSEVEEEIMEEEETAELTAGSKQAASRASVPFPSLSLGPGKRHKKIKIKSSSRDGGNIVATPEHNHSRGEESDVCEACIQYRRDHFGEVRLKLRFEFNEFGETCSHIWPEEPHKPPEATFSPNRVYYNALFLQQLAQPYVGCLQATSATVRWVRPWKSLSWFSALVLLLLHPCLLIVVINMLLAWRVVAAYLEHTFPPPEETRNAASLNNAGPTRSRSMFTKRSQRVTEAPKVPKNSVLPPIDEPGDEQLEELYRTVRRTKKLPLVVEEIGRRTFATDALPAQRLVERIGQVLMNLRRRLRPVKVRTLVPTAIALCGHMVLQLWLYRTSRFHLYLVGCCCGVFAYNFYAWRGRAFIAGVQEAVRCRQLRMSLDNNTRMNTASTATSVSEAASGGDGNDGARRAPFDGGLGRQAGGRNVGQAPHETTAGGGPVFAPRSATPATTDDQAATPLIENTDQQGHDDSERDLGSGGNASAAATNTAGKVRTLASTGGTKNGGAPETRAGPARSKSVRFDEDTVGGEAPSTSFPEPLGGTTGAAPPPAVTRRTPKGRDLWKLGGKDRRRTWKRSPSSGTLTYGSIDDIPSDEERKGDDDWDVEKGGELPGAGAGGVSRIPRRSFHGDVRDGGSGGSGGGGAGGSGGQSDALLTRFHEGQDSPERRRGWKGRFSRWYHDF